MSTRRARLSVPIVPLLALAAASAGCATSGARPPEPAPAAPAAAAPAQARSYFVYFGTYTSADGSRGIYRATLDVDTGALGPPELATETRSPSFLAVHPNGRFLYAVGEVSDAARGGGGLVSAYAIDPATGALQLLNQVDSRGAGPCHVSVDPQGEHVLIANYGGGSVASYRIQPDGGLAPASFVQHVGSSVNPRRQKEPHAHSIITDPEGRRVFSADLGIDKVLVYRLDRATGALAANDPPFGAVPPGGGPRHLAFHPSGRFLYTNNELTSSVTAFRYDPATGSLSEIQTLTTLPEGHEGNNSTAQILVTPDGRRLYVSNRGHDSIAMFDVDPATGRLTPLGHEPTQGKTPRNFNVDPTGTFVLAANQGSDSVVLFRIDAASGRLQATGTRIEVPRPVCVAFAPRH